MKKIFFCFLIFNSLISISVPKINLFNTNLSHYIDFGGNESSRGMISLNNNIYLAGNSDTCSGFSDFLLVKLNQNGEVLQTNCYGTSFTDQCLSVVKLMNSNILLLGQTIGLNSNINGFAILVDSLGNEINRLNYGSLTRNESFDAAVELSDGTIVFAGFVSDGFNSNNIFVAKFDSEFNLLFEDNFGGSNNDIAHDVIVDSEDNIYVIGDSESNGTNGGVDARIIKLTNDGLLVWDKFFGDTFNNGSQGLIFLEDNTIIIYGETEISTFSPFDFWCQKINLNGDSIWKRTFGGQRTDAIFNLILFENKFYCTGYSNSNHPNKPIDVIFMVLDSTGQEKSRSYFGREGVDIGYKIIELNGRFFISGKSQNNINDDIALYEITKDFESKVIETDTEDNLNFKVNFSLEFIEIDNKNENVFVEIFSLEGKSFGSHNLFKNSIGTKINLANLKNGVYICRIKTPNFEKKYKFIRL